MPAWLKYSLGGVLAVLLLIVGAGYYHAKSTGLIPREIYETVPPEMPSFNRPAVLVLNKANGFIHKDALPAADAMLKLLAEKQGWDIFVTDNAATHSAEILQKFQIVVWNNVSGDVLTETQRAAFKFWIEQGGGWVGLHASGGDPFYKWDWYVETLVGAQFVGHTMTPQFQDADILVADPSQSITSHLTSPWTVKQEEWYAFDRNPRDKGYEILLTLDENSYITVGEGFFGRDNMEGEHPIAWRHQVGEGRAFYSGIGHIAATYDLKEYQALVLQAMRWAAGDDK